MRMLEYISTIQRKLIDDFRFSEDPVRAGIPLNVPDGDYPMLIDGKMDHVKIEDGRIYCCNFEST